MLFQLHAETASAPDQGVDGLLENKRRRIFSAFCGRRKPANRDRGFSAACGPEQERAGAAIQASAHERVEFLDATTGRLAEINPSQVLGRDESGKHKHSAGPNDVVVIALAEGGAAQLCDLGAPPGLAILAMHLLQHNDAMHDAMQFKVRLATAA